jgi:choline dehydrogenase-like flavoprotein
MPQSKHFDAIINRQWRGGRILACHLALSGKRVLLIERGDELDHLYVVDGNFFVS